MTHADRLAAMRARNRKPPRVPLPNVKAYWLARWQRAVEKKAETKREKNKPASTAE